MLKSIKTSLEKFAKNDSFCVNQKRYTYFSLKERIINISHLLKKNNLSPQKSIGVFLDDDIDIYASVLAIWFANSIFVALDPKTPQQRNLNIVAQADVKVVLATKKLFDQAKDIFSGLTIIDISFDSVLKEQNFIYMETKKTDILYYLFTSGSTGTPKGVPINRGNLDAFIDSFWDFGIEIKETDRCLQMFHLTFDVSIACIILPLVKGACVHTIPNKANKYLYTFNLISREKITFICLVPSLLTYLKPYFDEIRWDFVKTCILTAEASHKALVENWAKCIPDANIYNLYGPTEATIWCLGYLWRKNSPQYNGLIPIGKPFKAVKAIIVDKNLKVVQDEKGELCLRGDQVTPGYLNNPEKTRQVLKEINGQVFYCTGDIVFIDKENFMFCGRSDYQVQIQGFRVELGEIENVIRERFQVCSVAIAYQDAQECTQIHLFVEGTFEKSKIKKAIQSKLPHYMVPAQITCLEKFPLNASGKIDKKMLGIKKS